MTDYDDFLNMTPEQLRKEADRRELVNAHGEMTNRVSARAQLADILFNIPTDIVSRATAREALINVVDALVKANQDEQTITNGQIHLAGINMPPNWWQEATTNHMRVDPNSKLIQYELKRYHPWR